MVLGNTYHLALRPGEKRLSALGGLHRFMGWDGPILTDSGGFQLYSLAQRTQVTEEEVVFRSPYRRPAGCHFSRTGRGDSRGLGSDVAMVLDHVVGTAQQPRSDSRCRPAHGSLGTALPTGRETRRSSPVCHRPRRAGCRTRVNGVPESFARWISRVMRLEG